jgi:hypothetical protein
MSESFFRIGRGLEIDELVQYLTGVGAPGSGDSGLSLVGSVYTDTLNGELWTKITDGIGVQHWSKQATQAWVANSVAGAVSWREPVVVIDTTTTVLPSGAPSLVVDGVTLANGARVLFAGLTPQTPNVYVYDLALETFTQDTNTLSQGDTVYVDNGTAGGTRWTWNGTAWVRFDTASIDELAFIRAFDGKAATGSVMPVYTSTSVVTQGTNLVTAISALDHELGAGVTTGNFISSVDSIAVNLQSVDTELGANVTNGNYILASNKMNGNIQALDTAFGPATGTGHWISNAQHVNGNLVALDNEIGGNVSNGNFVLAANTINQNVQALDTHLGPAVTTGSIIINTNSANTNIQLLDSKIGAVSNGNQVLASSTVSANIQALDTFIGADQVDGGYVLAVNTVTQNIQALDTALTSVSKESTVPAVTTVTVIDSIAATVVKWIVKIVDSANSANVVAYEVFAATNGVTTDWTKFATLKLGSNIAGLQVSVTLAGANLQLSVASTATVNVTSRRVSSL